MDEGSTQAWAERVFKSPVDANRRSAWQTGGGIGLLALGPIGLLICMRRGSSVSSGCSS